MCRSGPKKLCAVPLMRNLFPTGRTMQSGTCMVRGELCAVLSCEIRSNGTNHAEWYVCDTRRAVCRSGPSELCAVPVMRNPLPTERTMLSGMCLARGERCVGRGRASCAPCPPSDPNAPDRWYVSEPRRAGYRRGARRESRVSVS